MLYSLWFKDISRDMCPIKEFERGAGQPVWSASCHCLLALGVQTRGASQPHLLGTFLIKYTATIVLLKPLRPSES